MMGPEIGLAVLGMLACALFLPILIGGGYLVLRSRRAPAADPRDVLDHRLARGEISADDYLEIESALRSSQPARGRSR